MEKKNRKFRFAAIIISFLILLALYAYLRSFTNSIPYFKALDQLLATIISEFWKFISTPTILITISIFVFLWNHRENISNLISNFSEVGYKNGGLYIIFKTKQKLEQLKDDLEKEPVSDEKSKALLNRVIDEMENITEITTEETLRKLVLEKLKKYKYSGRSVVANQVVNWFSHKYLGLEILGELKRMEKDKIIQIHYDNAEKFIGPDSQIILN